jgi:hypothetical protein
MITSTALSVPNSGGKLRRRARPIHTAFGPGSVGAASVLGIEIKCKIWYLISRTVSEDDAHRGNNDDRSVGAFAVKRRAFGAPLCGIGA